MSRMNLLLRPGNSLPLDDLLALILEFNAEEGIATPASVVRPALERLIGDPSIGMCWVFEVRGEIAGYANLTFGYDLEYGGRDAWLTDFFLLPKFRGQGLATGALAELEARAREQGVNDLHLQVRPENTRALKAYAKSGFELIPRQVWTKRL